MQNLHVYTPPHALAPGARVALIAPAGPLRDAQELDRAVANTRALGWEPVVGAHALEQSGYFAGSDAHRLADLNSAIADPTVDGIWCLRGGYGVTRILDGVDYEKLRLRPRAIVGYSDITALHAAVGQLCGIESYHGPTARATLTPFTRASLEHAVIHHDGRSCATLPAASDALGGTPVTPPRTIFGGRARGRLAGGNLALLSALVGTPFFPNLDGAILILEDINEPVYKMDRMLHHLALAGMLRDVAGIAFGQCTACETEPEQLNSRTPRTLDHVLRELADRFTIPCVAGLPIGHVDDFWTVPLGASATLDADALTLTIGET